MTHALSLRPLLPHAPTRARSQSVYYVDSNTHETSWDAPPGFADSAAAAWVCHQDPEGSGQEYYVNEITGDTTWELPEPLR